MNKAEKLIVGERFEAVILALPEDISKNYDVLAKAVDAFRDLIKAL